MVVMITPVAFATIGYQTYIIFAVINAFIVPCVYFFYPETAYRSLEEMDEIFSKTTGYFDVVKLAKPKNTPNRKNAAILLFMYHANRYRISGYDKYGNLLHSYLDTEEHRRRSSVAGAGGRVQNKGRSTHHEGLTNEEGFASGSGSENEKNV